MVIANRKHGLCFNTAVLCALQMYSILCTHLKSRCMRLFFTYLVTHLLETQMHPVPKCPALITATEKSQDKVNLWGTSNVSGRI